MRSSKSRNVLLICAVTLILTGCLLATAAIVKLRHMDEPAAITAPVTKDTAAQTTPESAATEPTPIPTEPPTKPYIPEDEEFVPVEDYIPNIYVDLRYGTANNFTGQEIYAFRSAYLRYGTVKKLAAAQQALSEQGLSLKIWDAFRPVQAQFRLWEVCPDERFVANPITGFSPHSRGNTVDITMVTADGEKVEMPTDFDSFTAKADRDYSDCTETAAENARLLEKTMTEAGFRGYSKEWWHYVDTVRYEVEKEFYPPA